MLRTESSAHNFHWDRVPQIYTTHRYSNVCIRASTSAEVSILLLWRGKRDLPLIFNNILPFIGLFVDVHVVDVIFDVVAAQRDSVIIIGRDSGRDVVLKAKTFGSGLNFERRSDGRGGYLVKSTNGLKRGFYA
jgi:hypothetical protein